METIFILVASIIFIIGFIWLRKTRKHNNINGGGGRGLTETRKDNNENQTT